MDLPATKRGRPLDPDVSAAALDATLTLLEEHGYAGLRVADVAERAGIGLGALYRRWSTKQELVLSALRAEIAASADQAAPDSNDAERDLLDGLVAIADAVSGRGARLFVGVLAGEEPELAAAAREAKIEPVRRVTRARLRRVIGDVPDLDTRTDVGLALIVFRGLVLGRVPSRDEIRDEILPLLTGTSEQGRPGDGTKGNE